MELDSEEEGEEILIAARAVEEELGGENDEDSEHGPPDGLVDDVGRRDEGDNVREEECEYEDEKEKDLRGGGVDGVDDSASRARSKPAMQVRPSYTTTLPCT